MTLRRSTAALIGLAVLSQLPSGCCHPRPLLGRLNYCGPVFNRPLLAGGPVFGGVPAASVGVPVEMGGHAGYPVGMPVGGGQPGCAGCGAGPIGMAPGGYPQDGFAHAAGMPAGHVVTGGVPPQFTGYPTATGIGQPAPLGGPVVSTQLPPPTVMPKQ